MDKEAYRLKMKQIRANLPLLERRLQQERITAHVLAWHHFLEARVVMLYHPMDGEMDISPVIMACQVSGKQVLLPVCRPKRQMDAVVFAFGDELHKSNFGVYEPCGSSVVPTQIDLIFLPGLAFSMAGHRLGYGGGYYDRFLTKTNAHRVACCFSQQIMDVVPVEAHDQFVQTIITQAGVKCCKEGNV